MEPGNLFPSLEMPDVDMDDHVQCEIDDLHAKHDAIETKLDKILEMLNVLIMAQVNIDLANQPYDEVSGENMLPPKQPMYSDVPALAEKYKARQLKLNMQARDSLIKMMNDFNIKNSEQYVKTEQLIKQETEIS